MKTKSIIALALGASLAIGSCKDKDDDTAVTPAESATTSKVLASFASNIAIANLADLEAKAQALDIAINTYITTSSQSTLTAAQQGWYSTRISWEQSESFLFGPVATKELDPAIDSWPVNFVDIDSVVNGNATYTEEFINSLDPTLKGFHPIEYLLFGQNGTRKFDDLSSRQKDYLKALSAHLKRITAQMHTEWNVTGGNYATQVSAAGTPVSTEFATQQDAMLEIVNGMIGIVDEVSAGKIEDPFAAKDASLEESPFAKNSWTDFKNNITGVRNVYTGKYLTQGTSISAWVQQYNKSADTKILQRIDAAIANLGAYTTPFGEAIISQPGNITATQTVLDDLKTTMEEDLLPLILQHTK